jgi:hypothetical protein
MKEHLLVANNLLFIFSSLGDLFCWPCGMRSWRRYFMLFSYLLLLSLAAKGLGMKKEESYTSSAEFMVESFLSDFSSDLVVSRDY